MYQKIIVESTIRNFLATKINCIYSKFDNNMFAFSKFFSIISSNPIICKKKNVAITEFVHLLPFIIVIYDFTKILDVWFSRSKLQKLVIGLIKLIFSKFFLDLKIIPEIFQVIVITYYLNGPRIYVFKINAVY